MHGGYAPPVHGGDEVCFNPHPPVGAGVAVVYPIVDSDVKGLLSVQHVKRFVADACAFPVNTASVGGVFLTHHAAVHTAPAAIALEVRIRFARAIVVVVALFGVSFAVDAPTHSHRCFALLESGELHTPRFA